MCKHACVRGWVCVRASVCVVCECMCVCVHVCAHVCKCTCALPHLDRDLVVLLINQAQHSPTQVSPLLCADAAALCLAAPVAHHGVLELHRSQPPSAARMHAYMHALKRPCMHVQQWPERPLAARGSMLRAGWVWTAAVGAVPIICSGTALGCAERVQPCMCVCVCE